MGDARRVGARRWALLALRVALVLLAGRLLLAAFAPAAAQLAARAHGVDAEWTRLRLHVLRGAIEIEDLRCALRAREGEPSSAPFLCVETLRADLAVRDLLRGELRLSRAEARGVDLRLERRADGSLPLLDALAATAPDPQGEEPAPLSFLPAVRVDALRASSVRLDVHDTLASGEDRHQRFELDLRADDLGYPDRRAQVVLLATAPNLLDQARLELAIETRPDDAFVTGDLQVRGLQGESAAPWVATALGVQRVRGDRSASLGLNSRFDARLRVEGAQRDGIAASIGPLAIHAWAADGRVLARVADLQLEVAALRASGIRVTSAGVHDAALDVRIDADGAPCALGFAFQDLSAAEPRSSARATRAAPAPADHGAPGPPFAVVLDVLEARSVQASFTDERHEPPVALTLDVERALLAGVDTSGARAEPLRFEVVASADGVVGRIEARGAAALFGARQALEAELEARGLRPDALGPYLAELGLASTLVDGVLKARLVGTGRATPGGGLEGDLRLTGVQLADGERICGVRAVEALGVAYEPARPTLRIRDLLVRGTDVTLQRLADGALAGLGLRTSESRSTRRGLAGRAPAEARSSVAGLPTPASAAPSPLPRVEIERLAVIENRLSWRDEQLARPVDVVFDDCGLEVRDLRLFGRAGEHERATAQVKLWSRAAALVRDVSVAGTLTTRPGPLDLALELEVGVRGVTAAELQPYIDPTGLQEQLVDASMAARVALQVARDAVGWRGELELAEARLENGGRTVLGATLLGVRGVRLEGERVRIELVDVTDAHVHVARDPVGALLALGLRIPLEIFRRGESAAEGSSAGASSVEQALAALPAVQIRAVRVSNAALHWRDATSEPAIEAVARLELSADGVTTRSARNKWFPFALVAAVEGTASEVRVDGAARLGPRGAGLQLDLRARGLRAGSLAPYLPAGVACELVNGELDARAGLELDAHEAGGLQGRMELSRVRLAEAGVAEPLAALERFEVALERVDPAAALFEIGRVSASGLVLQARRGADERLHALGFSRAPRVAAEAEVDGARRAPDLTPPGAPRVVLGGLDLELARGTFRDELVGADPIELSGRVSTPSGQVLVDPEPENLAPFVVELEARAAPFARSLRTELRIAPWSEQPEIALAFTAEGLSGAGVGALGRGLSTWVDGTSLTEGVATGSARARLAWRRRSPLDLDLRAGFAAEVEVGRLEFRDAPGGRVLLALESAAADVARVDLATGDVHLRTLELVRPQWLARRTPAGFELLGLVLHPELRSSPAPAAPADSAEPGASPRRARAELRVDELLVRGIDVLLRDDAVEPPAVLPLVDLDLVVQRFTTRAFEEPRVIRFDAWLGAGRASMPHPTRAASVVTGLASAVGGALAGRREELRYEERLVFQEAALTGRIQFVPSLSGHAQATLSGLELLGFTGTAKQEGVDVGDGTLDASVRLRFRGEEGVRVDSELVFSGLSLSEPKSGPIEAYLTLPVPLDTVLFLLENADGEHRIPVGFTLDAAGLTRARIAGAAASAAASVIGSAVASAPLRVMSTFTDLFGITGGGAEQPPTASVAFGPGDAALPPAAHAALEPLVQKLLADADWVVQVQHRLGAADVERATRLANPPPEVCREIAEGLRARRAEIARSRTELAAEVRADWAAGDSATAAAGTQRLRALDAEAGHLEDALDRVLEHLKPGAERHDAKRARAAALAVARARVEALRAWFVSRGIPRIEERFEAKPPTFDLAADGAGGTILVVLRERPR
ncbi:MAG: DUF748 domain-containing protein [Planctomycetes bacterium]|nr:DUF748 domain-containing protein [Planctomycetota bacterium]